MPHVVEHGSRQWQHHRLDPVGAVESEITERACDSLASVPGDERHNVDRAAVIDRAVTTAVGEATAIEPWQ